MNEFISTPEKTEVDLLIVNGHVLTLNGRDDRFPDGAVAVQGAEIVAVGDTASIEARFHARKTLVARGCVVMPGLVNGHTHAAMTLFRGLADDLPLMDWLHRHIFPAERKLTEEWVYRGTLLACAEMILSGTTTFCDMYLFEHMVARAAAEAGMRALVGEVLYDFPSPHYGPIENGLRFTESLIREWAGDPLVHVAVEPHAIYTCSPDLLRRCDEIARRFDVPLIIHVSENEAEVRQVQELYGCRPVEHLERLGMLGPHLIADHCVALDDRDMELLAARSAQVIHNPESNMKLASGVAPVPKLLERGVNVALGTDGCASNNDLDLFGEMDTCAKLHKVMMLDPTVLPARSVLRMATRNGAGALGFGGKVGELTPGMWADIIVVDFGRPHLTPLYEPVSHLVYAARGADVRHSIIHGRLVMEDRKLLTLDVEEVMDHARAIARVVRS
ncbi:MAG: amidohydrolase [Syntrophobacteraceae bacterium]|jgi:5-methylthioadenosine/S-adenosylhomocysteine deaminase|nr:amidohydrolase [Syntrophobacteraceae bacterium]